MRRSYLLFAIAVMAGMLIVFVLKSTMNRNEVAILSSVIGVVGGLLFNWLWKKPASDSKD